MESYQIHLFMCNRSTKPQKIGVHSPNGYMRHRFSAFTDDQIILTYHCRDCNDTPHSAQSANKDGHIIVIIMGWMREMRWCGEPIYNIWCVRPRIHSSATYFLCGKGDLVKVHSLIHRSASGYGIEMERCHSDKARGWTWTWNYYLKLAKLTPRVF